MRDTPQATTHESTIETEQDNTAARAQLLNNLVQIRERHARRTQRYGNAFARPVQAEQDESNTDQDGTDDFTATRNFLNQ